MSFFENFWEDAGIPLLGMSDPIQPTLEKLDPSKAYQVFRVPNPECAWAWVRRLAEVTAPTAFADEEACATSP